MTWVITCISLKDDVPRRFAVMSKGFLKLIIENLDEKVPIHPSIDLAFISRPIPKYAAPHHYSSTPKLNSAHRLCQVTWHSGLLAQLKEHFIMGICCLSQTYPEWQPNQMRLDLYLDSVNLPWTYCIFPSFIINGFSAFYFIPENLEPISIPFTPLPIDPFSLISSPFNIELLALNTNKSNSLNAGLSLGFSP